jgi:hypothetical protein
MFASQPVSVQCTRGGLRDDPGEIAGGFRYQGYCESVQILKDNLYLLMLGSPDPKTDSFRADFCTQTRMPTAYLSATHWSNS